jgi:predicted PurR-regulated permease PerM
MAIRRQTSDPIKLTFLIFAIIAALYFAAEVLQPLALAVLLSFALTPFARFLERRGLPRVPAALLAVAVALGALGGIGYVVGQQLTALAYKLPDYRENIINKLSALKPTQETTLDRVQRVAGEVAETLDRPAVPTDVAEARRTGAPAGRGDGIMDVRVVEQPSFRERLQGAIGPILEPLAVGSIVLVLMLFLILDREGMSDRIIQLVGAGSVSLTTRVMEEIGGRISRYLAIFASYNTFIGLVIGLGLGAIGVPYVALWGFLAAALRFVPYAGPVTAFALPTIFALAHFPTWREPLMVIGLFAVVETISNMFLETTIFGRTTRISGVGLMVAAMFWTWLWGAVGLLLSTPLTVCLAVLGKYVPSLRFFAALLGEEAELEPDVRFYQRLLALDRDGAIAAVEAAMKQRPRVEVFDRVLVPALSRAERDAAQDELDETKQMFVWGVVGEVLDGLDGKPDYSLASPTLAADGGPGSVGRVSATTSVAIVGLAVQDTSDTLVLRMLGQLPAPSGCLVRVIAGTESSFRSPSGWPSSPPSSSSCRTCRRKG